MNKKYLTSISFFMVGLLGVFLTLWPFFKTLYIVKYDYVLQHILFYKEFFRLLDNGMPFWSWNSLLGLNFWGSKSYYLIGDPYAWIAYLIKPTINAIPNLLSYLLVVKFVVSYINFYIFSKIQKFSNLTSLLFSLIFAFSGWNLVFLEHPVYTSFYSFIPLLLTGLILAHKKNIHTLLVISVALLVSINFYLFWVVAWIFLIVWIILSAENEFFNLKKWFFKSLRLLLDFSFGIALSSIIWLPGLMHLLQSNRVGNALIEYQNWQDVNIASFISFTFIPMLKYLDGVFKEYWYYFNQVGLYIGVMSILLIPQILLIAKRKREKVVYSVVLILLFFLLISPKVGLFFHFTYSIRYTLIHTIIGIWLASKVFNRLGEVKIYLLWIIEFIVLILFFLIFNYYLPLLHPSVNYNPAEIELLKHALILSLLLTLLLTIISMLKLRSIRIYALLGLSFVVYFELYTNTQAALLSQKEFSDLPYQQDEYFKNALDYLAELDAGFYRIYTDRPSVSNIQLDQGYMGMSTYDTTYQYTLSDFLQWTRQYPETNWDFKLNDPTLNEIIAVQYGIIKNMDGSPMTDPWFCEILETNIDTGPYTIVKYRFDASLATTYSTVKDISELNQLDVDSTSYLVNELAGKLKRDLYLDLSINSLTEYTNNPNFETQTFDPITFNQNNLNFDFILNTPSLVWLKIPFDDGWTVIDNQQKLEVFPVQGGFIGLALLEGQHQLELSYQPPGYGTGLVISLISLILLCIYFIIETYFYLLNFNKAKS